MSVNPELTEYTIPTNVKIIGRDAFKNSKIKKIDILDGVTKIDICAFFNSAIESISSPNTGIMICITASDEVGLEEIDKITSEISSLASPEANIVFGMNFDETMGDNLKTVLIATKK